MADTVDVAMRLPPLEDRVHQLTAHHANRPPADATRVLRPPPRWMATWAACLLLAWAAGFALVLWC